MENNFKKYQPVIDTSEVEARFKKQKPFKVYTPNNYLGVETKQNNQDFQMQNMQKVFEETRQEEANIPNLLPSIITEQKDDDTWVERVGATILDIPVALAEGVGKFGEGIIDVGASLVGGVGDLLGAEEFSEDVSEFISKDYVGDAFNYGFLKDIKETSYINDADWAKKYIRGSVSSIGQMLPSIFVGGPAGMALFGVSAAGGGVEEAFQQGADFGNALAYGLLTGTVETAIEKLSGGIGGIGEGLIGKGLTNLFPNLSARLATNSLVNFASKAVGEGFEEIASEALNPYLKRITFDEDAPLASREQLLDSFVLGSLASGILQGANLSSSDVRISNNINDINNAIDMQIVAYENGRYSDAEKISEMVKQKAEKLGLKLGEEIDTTSVYAEKKLKEISRLESSKKDSDLQKASRLQETISEDLKKMKLEQRKEFISKNGLSYMYSENGDINKTYSNLTNEQVKDIKKVNNVLKKMDSDLKIDYVYKNKNVNGFYNRGDNSITINLNSGDPYRVVGIHEFTHSLEGSKSYSDLYNFVMDNLNKKGELNSIAQTKSSTYSKAFSKSKFVKDLDSKLQKNEITKEKYEEEYKKEFAKYVGEEIVASTISEEIFTNEDIINELVKEKESLSKRIYNWVKNKIKKQDIPSKSFDSDLKKYIELYQKAAQEGNIKKKIGKITDKKFSLKQDSEGKELTKEQKEFFKDTKVLDEIGNLLRVYHGTTWNFYVFDKQKADPEGFVGSGFYFTNKELDASKNYSTEETSPDLKNKISKLAEQIEYSDEVDYEEALERAKKLLVGNENNVLEVYLNMKKPLYLNTQILSFDDYYATYDNYNREDFDDEEEFEQQVYDDFYSEYEDLAYKVDRILDLDDYNYKQLSELIDYLIGNSFEGMTFEDLRAYINKNYEFYTDKGYINNEVARAIVEAIGYDGIILENVENEFYNMGLEKNTNHYIVFNSNQIKLVDNLKPTSNEDIRYSLKEKTFKFSKDYKDKIKQDTFFDDYIYKTVSIDKLVKDNDLEAEDHLSTYHEQEWGTDIEKYTINEDKINEWGLYPPRAVYKNGKYILEDGKHRIKALKNDGYEKIQLLVYNEKIKLPVKDNVKVEKQYVIDSADLRQAIVYNKGSINKVTNALIEKLNLKGKVDVSDKEKVADYIFKEINRNKISKTDISTEIAEFLIDSVKTMDNLPYLKISKEDLALEIQEELEKKLSTSWREGKFHNFQRYTIDKIYDLKHKDKAIKSIYSSISKLKEETVKNYKGLESAKKVEEILTKGSPIFDELTKKMEYKDAKDRIRKRKYKINNPDTRKFILNYKDFLVSNSIFEDEFEQSLIESVEYLRTKLSSNEKLTTFEIQIVDSFLKKIESIVNDYTKNVSTNKENEAKSKAVKVKEKIKSRPQVKTNFAKKITDTIIKPSDLLEHIEGTVYGEKSLLNDYIIKPMQEAEVKQGELFQKLFAPFESFFKENKKYRKSLNNKFTLKGENINKGQAISLYLLSKRQQARLHFMSDVNEKAKGIKLYDKNGNYSKTIVLTEGDIDKIESSFTEKDLEYIKLVENFFNNEAKQYNIETDLKYQGYTLVNDEYYYPIATDKRGNIYKTLGNASLYKKIDSIFGAYFNKRVNPDANNPIVLRSVEEVLLNHINMLSKYSSYAIPVKEIERFLNVKVDDKRLNETLNEKWYDFDRYLDKWILDIVSVDETTAFEKFTAKARSNLAVAQLGLNFKVIINQLSVIPTSFSSLKLSSISKGLIMKNNKESRKTMDKYCPYVQQRNYNNDYARSESNVLQETLSTGRKNAMGLIGTMDRFTIGYIWNACQVEVEKKNGHEIGTEENLKKAGELLEQVIRRTQATDTMEQPTIKRTKNEVLKFLTMYTTQNLQSISTITRSIMDLKTINERIKLEGNTEQNQKLKKQVISQIARSGSGILASNLMYVLIGMLFKHVVLGKKEDEETFVEELGYNFLETNLGMLPIVNNFYSLVVDGYDMKITALDSVNDLVTASKDLYNSLGKGNYDGLWYRFSKALSPVVGIPFKNINEYGMSVIGIFNPDLAYNYRSIWYNKQITEYSEDYVKAIKSNDTKFAQNILEEIYREKGVSLSDSSVSREINNLIKDLGTQNLKTVLPRAVNNTITYDNVQYKLSNSQINKFSSYYEKQINTNYKNLLNSQTYKGLSKEEKVQALKYINDYSYYNALKNSLNINTRENKLILLSGVLNISTLASATAKCKNSLKGNKQEIQKYINSLRLTKEQKYILYGYLGYKPLTDNAYTAVSNYLASKGYSTEEIKEILIQCNFMDDIGNVY